MALHILTKSRLKDLRQLSKNIYKGKRREIRFLSLSFFDYNTDDLHLDLFFTDFKYIFLDYGLNHVSPLPSHSLVVLYDGNWEQNNLSIAWRHKDTILLQASLFSKETIFIKKHENRGHSQHPLPERDRTPKSILARKNIKSLQTLEL